MKKFIKEWCVAWWKLITFQMKDTYYSRWFEIGSSVLVLVGTTVFLYGIYKGLN